MEQIAIYLRLSKEDEFVKDDDIVYLRHADAYFIALVKSIEEMKGERDHVNEGEKNYIIKAEPLKIIIKITTFSICLN